MCIKHDKTSYIDIEHSLNAEMLEVSVEEQ